MLEAQIAESRANGIDFEEKMIQAQMMLFKKSREEIVNEPEGVMGANAVELAEDMVTIASEPVRIVPGQFAAKGTSFEGHAFYEGSSIRKIRGIYYFIYSSQWNHELVMQPVHSLTEILFTAVQLFQTVISDIRGESRKRV